MKKSVNELNTNTILSVVFGAGAILIFMLEIIYSNNATTLETSLFSTLEFGFSIGLGWTLQKIDSKRQFQESLRAYGFSAHRRIKDIEKALIRLQNKIIVMTKRSATETIREIEGLELIVEGIMDTAKSSMVDWADVIGDDVKKQEQLQELEKQYQQLSMKDEGQSQELSVLKNKIEELRSDIPMLLGMGDAKPLSEYETPEVLRKILEHEYYENGQIHLKAKINDSVPNGILESLSEGVVLSLHAGMAMHSFDFIVYYETAPSTEMILGELDNPYAYLNCNQIEYNKAVLSIIYDREQLENKYPSDTFTVSFVKINPKNRNEMIIRYPILKNG